jgi:hypothetical protein
MIATSTAARRPRRAASASSRRLQLATWEREVPGLQVLRFAKHETDELRRLGVTHERAVTALEELANEYRAMTFVRHLLPGDRRALLEELRGSARSSRALVEMLDRGHPLLAVLVAAFHARTGSPLPLNELPAVAHQLHYLEVASSFALEMEPSTAREGKSGDAGARRRDLARRIHLVLHRSETPIARRTVTAALRLVAGLAGDNITKPARYFPVQDAQRPPTPLRAGSASADDWPRIVSEFLTKSAKRTKVLRK